MVTDVVSKTLPLANTKNDQADKKVIQANVSKKTKK
jgi:hypothetical protein